jgi:hypothetical protein
VAAPAVPRRADDVRAGEGHRGKKGKREARHGPRWTLVVSGRTWLKDFSRGGVCYQWVRCSVLCTRPQVPRTSCALSPRDPLAREQSTRDPLQYSHGGSSASSKFRRLETKTAMAPWCTTTIFAHLFLCAAHVYFAACPRFSVIETRRLWLLILWLRFLRAALFHCARCVERVFLSRAVEALKLCPRPRAQQQLARARGWTAAATTVLAQARVRAAAVAHAAWRY